MVSPLLYQGAQQIPPCYTQGPLPQPMHTTINTETDTYGYCPKSGGTVNTPSGTVNLGVGTVNLGVGTVFLPFGTVFLPFGTVLTPPTY